MINDKIGTEHFLRRCLGETVKTLSKLISGKHIYRASEEPFAVYADFHVDPRLKNSLSELSKLKIKWGREYERQLIEKIFPSVNTRSLQPFSKKGISDTLLQMEKGQDTLYKPPLIFRQTGISGRPSLLKRDDSQCSILGNYFYRLYEVKKVWQVKELHLLQAAFYNLLIGQIQNYTPNSFFIIKRNGEIKEICHEDLKKQLFEVLEFIRAIMRKEVKINPLFGECSGSEWEDYCNEQALKQRNLSILTDADQKIIDALERRNIRTIDQLAETSVDYLRQIEGVGKKLSLRIFHQSKAYVENKPIVYGSFNLKVLECTNKIFISSENTDTSHPDIQKFTYLIGYLVQRGKWNFGYQYHFAFSQYEEEISFREFVNTLLRLSNFKIFHWGPVEKNTLKRLFNKYFTQETSFMNLNTKFFDLRATVKDFVVFPEPSLSAENIAPFFDFHSEEKGTTNKETAVLFFQYLQNNKEEYLERILKHNENNCKFLLAIYRWLSKGYHNANLAKHCE